MGICCTILFVLILALLIYICWEPSSPPEDIKSEYDVVYVENGEDIVLYTSDITELQNKVLDYVHSFKNECTLKVIYVLLNRELKTEQCTFWYAMDDVEGYYGVFEVICYMDDENWLIKSASVSYHEGMISDNNSYSEDKDVELKNKIDDIVSYIRQERSEQLDKYLIKIFNKDIFVRGYEQRDDGEIWDIKLTVNENGVLGAISD